MNAALTGHARQQYREVEGRLISVHFYTVSDYLYLLQQISQRLDAHGRRALVYLAAAVSDFHLPTTNLAAHKIQSDEGPMVLRLMPVPKLIRPLVRCWCPQAFIVSFKLETDARLLIDKARAALEKYQHHAVVANLLRERRDRVLVLTARREEAPREIRRKMPDEEIEGQLVALLLDLFRRHQRPDRDGA